MRALCLVALLAWGAPASANPLDAFGFGARGVALGGAMTALADDTSANYYNPAGLARGRDLRLELGYTLVSPSLAINGGDQGVDASRGFQGGVVMPGTLFGHAIGLSVGVHLPDERISRIRALPQRQPRWVLYDNRPQRIVISSSGGVEIVPDLYVGAGLTYLANTSGTLDIEGIVGLTDVEQTRLLSAVDVDLAAIRYWTVGALFERGPWRIGLTWRQAFSLRLDLDVDVHGQVLLGPENVIVEEGRFLFNSTNDNLYAPEQLLAGVAYETGPWLLSLDLGWIRWSAFPSPTAEVALELNLEPLQLSVPVPAEPEPPGFHDTLLPRLGVEYQALDGRRLGLTLRAGAFFEPTPAPDQPGSTNYVDSDRHGASAGIGLRLSELTEVLPKPIWIELGGVYIRLTERTYRKADPADPIGDYRAAGSLLGVTTQLSLRF